MGDRRLMVWGDTLEKEPIRLRLVQEEDEIVLQLVDAEGRDIDGGCLIRFEIEKGNLRGYLPGGIGDRLPVLTDENGRMIVA